MSEDDVNDNPEEVEASADDDWAAAMQEQEVAESQEQKSNDDTLGFEEFDNEVHFQFFQIH